MYQYLKKAKGAVYRIREPYEKNEVQEMRDRVREGKYVAYADWFDAKLQEADYQIQQAKLDILSAEAFCHRHREVLKEWRANDLEFRRHLISLYLDPEEGENEPKL